MTKNAIKVTWPSLPPMEEFIEEIRTIWDNHWLTHTGPKHQELEKELCDYLKVENVALFSNGHMALELALDALNLSGEVITTPFTFASTTQAIVRNGLQPVFCDIEPDWYTIDTDLLENLITEKTTAIVPVHVYGHICNWKEIDQIARKYNLKVIYDAAHAFGVTIDGKGIGTYGDVSMFSFHATKVFNTIEGGGLTYSNASLSKEFAALRQFGMYEKDESAIVGTNAKMSEFQAAMGICNLRHINSEIAKRKEIVLRYREHLGNRKGIKICEEQDGVTSNYSYFPVQIDPVVFGTSRDEIVENLQKEGIFARKYFHKSTSKFPAYKGMFPIQSTPVADLIATRILTLPLYPDLGLDDVEKICKVVLEG